ncbi:IMV heparin binding surface protein [Equine molluscum contagiosum-like virus]|nr:IMV heparin binding surface protein [Equine molluscum contagiosum-like virus]
MANVQIPLYIVKVAGRPVQDVVPSEHRDAVIVRMWDQSSAEAVSKGADYYSGLCHVLCSEETKQTIRNHLSLWGSFVDRKEESDYALVVEDDNTVLQLLLDLAPALTTAMRTNNIDILQLADVLYAGTSGQVALNTTPATFAYAAPLRVNLSAYLIHKHAALRLHEELVRSRVTAGLGLELARLERSMNLRRMVLSKASEFVAHDYSYRNKARHDAHGASWRQRAGDWLSRRYPDVYSTMTMPVFSLFGRFDVSVLALLGVLLLVVLVAFDVHSRLAWLITGALLSLLLQ